VEGEKADYGPTRQLCADCPVRQECFEVALADDSPVGLWGGTTEVERRVSLALVLAPCPTIRHRTSLIAVRGWSRR
jgi:hypothetical protein